MATLSSDVTATLTSLRERWGGAAPRPANEVFCALAVAATPADSEEVATVEAGSAECTPRLTRAPGVFPTGFAALDAMLGPGGLPRDAAAAIGGDGSSGKTTLALRLAAQIQATGGIVAYIDLASSLDPVEAVARGVRLEWLVALTPRSLDEGLSMAGSLLQDRAVDLLVIDLPSKIEERSKGAGHASVAERGVHVPIERPALVAERLRRLIALGRRAPCALVVLEPRGLPPPVRHALAESAAVRVELTRRSWIRLGRDVVGQRTEVVVARNRFGPPGRRAELRILYANGGSRDQCLLRPHLLAEASPSNRVSLSTDSLDASSPPFLAAPAPRSRPVSSPRATSGWSGGRRWTTVVSGIGP